MPAASPNPPVNTDANLTRFRRHFHLYPGERAGLAAGTTVVALLPAKPADDVPQEVCVVAHLRELHEIFWNAEIAF